MLHLQSRVHLDEEELAVLVEELDRAGARIAEPLDRASADVADARALLGIEGRGVCLLPHLLVPALQRAVALAQMHAIPAPVSEHLDFDVARLAQVFLDIDAVVAEGRPGFRARRRQRLGKARLVARNLHAAPAAARCSLDQHGVTDAGGDALGLDLVGYRAVRTGNARDAKPSGGILRLDLVAHDANMLGARADEGDAVRFQNFGELGVFRQEAVARMDRVSAGDFAGSEDLVHVEVAVARWRRPDAHALVSQAHMHCLAVGRRMDGDRGDAQLLAGAQDAQRDLAAISYEYLVEHLLPLTR